KTRPSRSPTAPPTVWWRGSGRRTAGASSAWHAACARGRCSSTTMARVAVANCPLADRGSRASGAKRASRRCTASPGSRPWRCVTASMHGRRATRMPAVSRARGAARRASAAGAVQQTFRFALKINPISYSNHFQDSGGHDMALVSMRQLLDHAAENGYGIPAFNVNNLEQVQAIMEAAAETDSPVIMQASAGARKYAGEGFLKYLIQAAVESYPHIPVVMHQDHGQSPAICKGAIDLGFSSVMMDGSLEEDGKSIADYE